MNRRWAAVLVVALTTAGVARAARAAPADTSASRILDELQRSAPRSEEYVGEVTVIARDGKVRRKQWHSYRSGAPGQVDRLIRFLWPPDVRGVGYLARHRPGRAPEEWLYLPSMKRERRIGARDRDAAFVGTSFNYEDLDLLEFDPARYDAVLLAPGTMDGEAVHVIALTPKTPSAYRRKVLTIQQAPLRLLSVDFFIAGSEAPAKRMSLGVYATLSGYSVATRIEMADVRKANRTVIALRDIALDQPQPSDRFTIQNLLREHDDELRNGAPVTPSFRQSAQRSRASRAGEDDLAVAQDRGASPAWAGTISGYAELKGIGAFGQGALKSSASSGWGTVLVTDTNRMGPAQFVASVRLEASSSPQVGALRFDPADRAARRSPVSVRRLSLVIPVRPGIDLEAGRFDVAWGQTDGYSPADAFFPRDLSDPLTEERLPLWGARLRAERGPVRVEWVGVPVTTPWRLPALGGPQSPFALIDLSVDERPWTVPKDGFQAARVTTTMGAWETRAWARGGLRPAPVLDTDVDDVSQITSGARIAVDRHFSREWGVGGSLSRDYGGWIVHSELGLLRSPDAVVGNAAIWAIGASRTIGNGTFTGTVASNAVRTPTEPLLLFDRALLPAVILAVREYTAWGSWRLAWLGTFHTVGGTLTAETTRNLTDVVALTAGADLPHGAALSPARAFAGGQRVRGGIRWSW